MLDEELRTTGCKCQTPQQGNRFYCDPLLIWKTTFVPYEAWNQIVVAIILTDLFIKTMHVYLAAVNTDTSFALLLCCY